MQEPTTGGTERLRRAEERFRLAASLATDHIYEWHVETDELLWFGDIDEALGFPAGEFWEDRGAPVVGLDAGTAFLQKPFDIGTLTRRVREALDSR